MGGEGGRERERQEGFVCVGWGVGGGGSCRLDGMGPAHSLSLSAVCVCGGVPRLDGLRPARVEGDAPHRVHLAPLRPGADPSQNRSESEPIRVSTDPSQADRRRRSPSRGRAPAMRVRVRTAGTYPSRRQIRVGHRSESEQIRVRTDPSRRQIRARTDPSQNRSESETDPSRTQIRARTDPSRSDPTRK